MTSRAFDSIRGPCRTFDVVVADVVTRSDATIRAGDELIAFGTGFPTGVHYLSDGHEHLIPSFLRMLEESCEIQSFMAAVKKIGWCPVQTIDGGAANVPVPPPQLATFRRKSIAVVAL